MEPSNFLDLEEINLKRESLNQKFYQFKIIDDSITPYIIQWLIDFFSFYEDLTLGVFISNKNIDVENWAFFRVIGKSFVQKNGFQSDLSEFINKMQWDVFEYISNEIDILSSEIMNEFYLKKLPILEPISTSLVRGIAVLQMNSNEFKKNFDELKNHIENYYQKGLSINSEGKETQQTKPKEPDWHPFSNIEVKNFYLFIEKKHGSGNKTFFGAYWKFLTDNGLVNNKSRNLKKRYVEWINLRFGFLDDEKIERLQTNSSKLFRDSLLDDLVEYEDSFGHLHNYLDDGNKKRTKNPILK